MSFGGSRVLHDRDRRFVSHLVMHADALAESLDHSGKARFACAPPTLPRSRPRGLLRRPSAAKLPEVPPDSLWERGFKVRGVRESVV